MLSIALKHGLELSNDLFECKGRHNWRIIMPHRLEQMGILNCQFSASSKCVFLINLFSKHIFQEIIRQKPRVWDTLNWRVHKTCIPEILKSSQPHSRIVFFDDLKILCNLVLLLTLVMMELLIFLHTFIIAVPDLFTRALHRQRLMSIAVFAFPIA